ncbi:MAG: DUF4230 domain-containing protein [Ruminococcus sp.]
MGEKKANSNKRKILKFLTKTKKRKTITAIVILVIVISVALSIFISLNYNYQAKVDTEYLNALVSKSSELTTAKLNYTGMTKYTDEGIDIINKADFTMVYKATVRAGINVDEVEITSDDENKIIYVSIPKATVQEIKIDNSSIEYFDQKFALFNTDEKEDNNKAIALAEEAAEKEAANMGVLELANEQSATLIKGILANAIPDGYIIEVKNNT